MLERLLSLLIHAKGGAISGVLLLGATGALVSVSAQNGVTTISQASPSPSPSASLARLAPASPKPLAPSSPTLLTSPTQADACTDQAKALALQVQRVESAFRGFHADLVKLRGQRAAATLEKADATLKQIRQAAVKALDATLTCTASDGDEDEADTDEADADEADDAAAPTIAVDSDSENDEDSDEDSGTKGTSPIVFSGTDPNAIADQAVRAMQAAVDTARSATASTPKPIHSPEQPKHESNDSEHDD